MKPQSKVCWDLSVVFVIQELNEIRRGTNEIRRGTKICFVIIYGLMLFTRGKLFLAYPILHDP